MGRRSRYILVLGLFLGLAVFQLAPSGDAQSSSTAPQPNRSVTPGVSTPTATPHSSRTGELLLGLIIILVGAKLGGELFQRVGQPAVLGEILVGIALGNLGLLGLRGLDFIRSNDVIAALSELGVILLLFEVGLESNIGEMRRVGLSSLVVATLGVIAPFGLGWGVSAILLPGESALSHVFIGATLCATSVGITARVLRDLGQLDRPEARIILGAAVIDDVMGLVVLAVVSGVITAELAGGSLSFLSVAVILGKSVGFLFGAVAIGSYLSRRLFKLASYLHIQHVLLVTSLGFCFSLAWLASQIELAPIVGAFAAGLILDPVHYRDFAGRGERPIEELIRPIGGFLVPIFFVVTGASVELKTLGDTSVLGLAAILAFVAVLGKQACSLGVLERGLDRLSVGIGMIPRGEVGLIFANIGLGLRLPGPGGTPQPVVTAGIFSAVVIVVLVTTLVTPPLLKWSLSRLPGEDLSGPANERPDPRDGVPTHSVEDAAAGVLPDEPAGDLMPCGDEDSAEDLHSDKAEG